ncbi:glycosyltransferase family 4 protein [Fictibacillus arsenicus]|uniref:Glycosyltransferase family 1 protein n=1 Tax=Fictibacillus arsenicus TaxID=255247 RepID=A0A1V3GCM2_9BACL|nr:glycosyltransferase family 4 protein [Fictibacillus arsenicus]OOE14594.1 glycosyltransferase family 1 protein [Fictibacillus arsenicus]
MKMKKVLFCATVDSHFKAFHLPVLRWFKEQGWEVHVAAAGSITLPFVDQKFSIPIQRSPFHEKNFKAYQSLKSIINKNNYDFIHCHTPMGGVLTRIAARNARKMGTKVFYTVHGFHFCKGAPLTNWLIYYPIEKILSTYTDCLITINSEDYQLAHNHKFSAAKIKHIHGVGVDTERFKPISINKKQSKREVYGYKKEDFLLFYAAEFNKNKNQQFLIHSLALVKERIPQVKLLLAGTGPLLEDCKKLAKDLGVFNFIDFLGYRKDIHEILPMCDLAVASSLREGLPVNIMEAMACELPVIATHNRGHIELVQNNKTGWLIKGGDVNDAASKIISFAENGSLKERIGKTGRQIVHNKYAINKILEQNVSIYTAFMEGAENRGWAVP